MYLVVGGAGFIGSHIIETLLRRGRAVRVLDNFSTGKRNNLYAFKSDIEVIEGDIRSYPVVEKAIEGVEVIFHQAALPSVPRSIADPITTNEVNVTGTLNILEAARRGGVRKVVYASSSSIYGDSPTLPKHEDMNPAPVSPYAVSKLATEQYCEVFSRVYGLETIGLRYFNVFGPRQDPETQYASVVPRFITSMLRDERPVIYGDGEQTRDFTYIDNAVTANLLAASVECRTGLVLNIACKGRYSLNELVAEINRILGKDIAPRYAEPRSGDIKHSFADISRAEHYLGYKPDVHFVRGLEQTVVAYQAYYDRMKADAFRSK